MRNLSLGIITTALLALLFSPAVRADLVLSMQPVISAAPGSTGNAFDVLLTNTGASSVDLGAFAYEITTADTDISFTDADTSTTAPTSLREIRSTTSTASRFTPTRCRARPSKPPIYPIAP